MMIKMTRHGRGSAQKAAVYLTQEMDSKKETRPHIEVLRGDPFQVAAVADGLDFKNKYSSGVIAFSPEEKPTPAEIDAVIDSFEEVAYAGLEPERRCFSAILHGQDNGGCHIHIFAARVDLTTGKSFNAFPPGWQKTFGAWRDGWNYEKGWARPDDLARARLTQPKFAAYDNRQTSENKINQYLEGLVHDGDVNNRGDVIAVLKDLDVDIISESKKFIGVKFHPEQKKNNTAKGAFTWRKLQRG